MSRPTPDPTPPTAAAVEGWMVEYLRKRFPAHPTDAETSFQALGLDSLGAVEMMQELENRLGRRVPAATAFEFDTPREVAAFLAPPPSNRGPA